ncbi:hypothetical protein CEXT_757931 [Caerostris extrusa]|uniref:Uncharacterized protein n=1 Tax=Caerostris extrusa TaxID=172846 RepID=A0AAV4P3I2_CAEEX|nr:hypothetical protein CEXT_757931 [Caerostris extrusa]
MSLLPRKQPEIPELYILTQLLPLFPVDNEGYKKPSLNNMKSKRVAILGAGTGCDIERGSRHPGPKWGPGERTQLDGGYLSHSRMRMPNFFSGYVHVRRLRNFFFLQLIFVPSVLSGVEASATLGCFCQEIWLTWAPINNLSKRTR